MGYLPSFWSAGNVHNLVFAVAVAAGTGIELKWGFLGKIRAYDWQFGRMRRLLPKPYVLLSANFAAWFWVTLFLFVDYDKNVLLVRVADFGLTLGTGHVLAWAAIAAVFTVWGWSDLSAGFLAVGVFSSLHELLWYFFYAFAYGSELFTAYPYYVPFMLLGISLTVSFLLLKKGKRIRGPSAKQLIMCISVMAVFDAMWLLAGFPVTVDILHGGTGLFGNLQTNLIEDLSWVMPGMVLLF